MAVGFRIKDASGNVTIDSTKTTALLQERIEKTATGSGDKTYTGITSRNSYAVGLCETASGDNSASTWTGIDFNIVNSIVGTNPKVAWNIACDPISGLGDCSKWGKYHIFVFMK
jgi:hypothetical protein